MLHPRPSTSCVRQWRSGRYRSAVTAPRPIVVYGTDGALLTWNQHEERQAGIETGAMQVRRREKANVTGFRRLGSWARWLADGFAESEVVNGC